MKKCTNEEWRVLQPGASLKRKDAQVPEWQPFVRHRIVNIACMPGTSSDVILREVEVVRRQRIGFDGHFPSIVLWLSAAITPPSFSKALASVDTSTPKLRAVIPCIGSENMEQACEAALEYKSCHMTSQLLFILHSDCLVALERIVSSLEDKGLMPEAWFEWLFKSKGTEEWWQCCHLIDLLDSAGYAFARQGLSSCGGIAALVRARILAEFMPSEMTSTETLRRAADRGASPPFICTSATIQALAPTASSSLRCTCQVPVPPLEAIEKAGKAIDKGMLRPVDEILFEDWQYIYDGFEIA